MKSKIPDKVLFNIKKATYSYWFRAKRPKKLKYKDLLKAVKKATEKKLQGDFILPVVFPNAAGLTQEDFKRKGKKK